MKNFLQKFIICIIGIELIFSPIISTKAQSSTWEDDFKKQHEWNAKNNTGSDDIDTGDDPPEEILDDPLLQNPPNFTTAEKTLIGHLNYEAEKARNNSLELEESLVGSSSQKIVLSATDALGIRSLYCLATPMVDFENDFENLAKFITSKTYTAAELRNIKFTDPTTFQNLINEAMQNWGISNKDLIYNDNSTISCITGFDANQIEDLRKKDEQYLKYVVDDAIESLKYDIRVLKSLVYLVTPKDMGGAGHRKIKVSSIRKGYTSKALAYSRESAAVQEALNSKKQSSTTTTSYGPANDFGGKTAAEIGMSREVTNDALSNQYPAISTPVPSETLASGTAEDSDGSEYDVWLANQSEGDEKNISAHYYGKAFDITEMDDIRCTLIKKRRLGGYKRTKYSNSPIRLAWQTREGYSESGGNDQADIGDLFKSLSTDSLRDLISQFGADISDYEGDLSKADFSDITKLVGQLMLGSAINSPQGDLTGFNIEDTLNKVGSAYFADFLGLPKEIFLNNKINSVSDLQTVIGESAVETRLKLPLGTLKGNDLDNILTNIGRRKIEHEMGLDADDLNGVLINSSQNSGSAITKSASPLLITAIGQKVIEKTLNLEKGSFKGSDFGELKNNVGKYKSSVLFLDPTYLDTSLHLESGTAKGLISVDASPAKFATTVGKIRLDDTAYGLEYLAANDSAYGLPKGTWTNALSGSKTDLQTIGSYTLSKSFFSNTKERESFIKWVASNTAKSSDEACKVPERITVIGEAEGELVTLSEEKSINIGLARGDLFRLFGCANSSTDAIFERVGSKILYYGIVNYALNPEDKAKIDLADTNLEFYSSNPETAFYLNRGTKISEINDQIKEDVKDLKKYPQYEAIGNTVDKISNLVSDSKFKLDKDYIKNRSRELAITVDNLKTQVKDNKDSSTEFVNEFNNLIFDVNEMVRLVSEIIDGEEIPGTGQLTFGQIPSGIFSDDTQKTSTNTERYKGKVPVSVNRSSIMLLLSNKFKPKDFFISIGAEKMEQSMSLPSNSLVYYIQNYEKKSTPSREAFFQAIGQARIEEEFNMPTYYFQGPELIKNMPDFANDSFEVTKYINEKPSSYNWINDNNFAQKLFDVTKVKVENPEHYRELVILAEKNWESEYNKQLQEQNNNPLKENTVYDIVKNIQQNKLTDGIRDAEDDLIFRMGLSGDISRLTSGGNSVWENLSKRTNEIDKEFQLKKGTTQALFTGKFVQSPDGKLNLSNDEKESLSAKLNISLPAIDKYLSYLNGESSLSELKEASEGIFYNGNNPWAKKADGENGLCPVEFTMNDGFSMSEGLLSNSYVYIDSDGAHSFANESQAREYRTKHADKQINVITEFAIAVAKNSGLSTENAKTSLTDFLTNKSIDQALSNDQISSLTKKSQLSSDIFYKLFSRKSSLISNSSVQAYKKAVGQAEARRIITWKLFGSIGIGDLGFDADDLFDVLNGNVKSLYTLGSKYIDNELNLPSGTIENVIFAKSANLRECSIAEAGASYLGSFVGLQKVSLAGNIYENIGSAKIEEILKLPKNSFGGETLSDLIDRTGGINFALAFDVPLKNVVSNDHLSLYFSKEYSDRISRTTDQFKLKEISNYITNSPTLSDAQIADFRALDKTAKTRTLEFLSNKEIFDKNYTPSKDEFGSQTKLFLNNLSFLDSTFGLTVGTTKALLTEEEMITGGTDQIDMGMLPSVIIFNYGRIKEVQIRVTPERYKQLVAGRTTGRIAATKFGEMLGLNGKQSNAALNLIQNFKELSKNKQYGDIYSAASTIMETDLDEKAGFEQGTISQMLNNPKHATQILFGQAVVKFDEQLGLAGSGSSFGETFKQYLSDDVDCDKIINSDADIEAQRVIEEKEAKTKLLSLKSDAPGYEHDFYQAQYKIDEINEGRTAVNNSYHACKNNARLDATIGGVGTGWDYMVGLYEEMTLTVSARISNKISETTRGTVEMPVDDVKELVFNGDMRYLEAATISYAANRIINKENKEELIPPYLRISYDDIKLALIGDKEIENAASEAALTSYYVRDEIPVLDQSFADYMYGDICQKESSFEGCIRSDKFLKNFHNPDFGVPRDYATLKNFNNKVIASAYGVDTISNDQKAEADKRVKNIEKYVLTEGGDVINGKSNCGDANDPASIPCIQAKNDYMKMDEAFKVDEEARANARRAIRETLQYKAIDAMLWKVDRNIFPGFSYALMKGNADVKTFALSNYLLVGLERGEIFGKELGFKVPRADMWIKTYNFVSDPTAPNALTNFVDNGGFDFVNDFVNQNSMDWFGFELPPDTFGAILVGVSTGVWRKDQATGGSFNENKLLNISDSKGNILKKLPTLEQVSRNFVASKLFNWGDKQLGIPVGSSYQIYTAYRAYVDTKKVYTSLKAFQAKGIAVDAFAKLSTPAQNAIKSSAAAATNTTVDKVDFGSLTAEQQTAATQKATENCGSNTNANQKMLIAVAVNIVFAKQISSMEESLGLVPGTGAMLVTMFITGFDPISVGIFVLMNLFGYYKVELKCSADGYYPEIERKPNPDLYDVTGLGVWNGMSKSTMQAKSIQAAQYKARILVGDMLDMQYKRPYENIIPSQIMTGRQEDVDFWNTQITVSMCSKIGLTSIGGICGGNTRAGVWKNPQTVAWTHVGF